MTLIARRRAVLAPAASIAGSTWTDAFNGTNGTNLTAHALDTGQPWAYDLTGSSDTTVVLNGSGRAKLAAAGFAEVFVNTPAPSAIEDVSLDFYPHDTDDYGYVFARSNNSSDISAADYFMWEFIWNTSVWTVSLSRLLTGALLYATDIFPAMDAALNMRLSLSGNTLTMFSGGSSYGSLTDSGISAAGYVGWGASSASNVMTCDNFSATFS